MGKLKITGTILFFILVFSSWAFPQETITITTYYPSPYGKYGELAANRMKIGVNYSNQNVANNNLIVEGQVGIGTVSPSQKLEVNGGIRAYSATAISGDNSGFGLGNGIGVEGKTVSGYGVYAEASGGGYALYAHNSGGGRGAYIDSASGQGLIVGSGSVGIGTDTPTQKLDVEGDVRIRGLSGSGTANVAVLANGTLTRSGASGTCVDVTVDWAPFQWYVCPAGYHMTGVHGNVEMTDQIRCCL